MLGVLGASAGVVLAWAVVYLVNAADLHWTPPRQCRAGAVPADRRRHGRARA